MTARYGRQFEELRRQDELCERMKHGPQFATMHGFRSSHLPPQHNQLISERGVLCLKPALRLEWRDQGGQG